MNLKNYYWYFQSAIPPKICDDIIKYGLDHKGQLARTGDIQEKKSISGKKLTEQELKDLSKTRKSNVVWMDDRWIYKEIHPYINQANVDAEWNFEWGWSESCQFTKYKLNEFYDWHCDSWDRPYDKPDKPNQHAYGKIRKLSVTVSLSDGTEYEGGDFEFGFRSLEDSSKHTYVCKEIRPKGSVLVFPSFVWHRVNPITSGIRYSLVVWNLGWPFK